MIWTNAALNDPGQLRQRVACVLSQILVVSPNAISDSEYMTEGFVTYYDIFVSFTSSDYRVMDYCSTHCFVLFFQVWHAIGKLLADMLTYHVSNFSFTLHLLNYSNLPKQSSWRVDARLPQFMSTIERLSLLMRTMHENFVLCRKRTKLSLTMTTVTIRITTKMMTTTLMRMTLPLPSQPSLWTIQTLLASQISPIDVSHFQCGWCHHHYCNPLLDDQWTSIT